MDDELRSRTWLGDGGKNGFIARHHLRAMGLGTQQLTSKPVIGIANTWSELTPCNAHLRSLAEAVKRGVLEAGGLPLEFPVMSLGEPFLRPSSMLYRNLMALEVEESLRANPLDAAVLLTGCDKTTPAALMGAASVDLPAVMLTGGPMLNGKYRGKDVGSGTDIWRMTEALRAGEIAPEEFTEFESCLNRSAGHCMTMGTASTMASLAEAMGMQLPGSAALPAVDSRRGALAEETGRLAVSLARERIRPSAILTRAAFENAVKVNAAIGGSTNAVIHLLAIAGRAGVELSLDDFDVLGRDVPLLVDLMPSGRYLMEEVRLCRRGARAAKPDARRPAPRRPHGLRAHAGRRYRGRGTLQRRRHPRLGRPGAACRCRYGGPARKPRPRRGGAEDQRRIAAPSAPRGAGARLR